ncbi:hypothetical protein B0H65DRAFT_402556, partial [Neurospora tetraspora]
YIKYLRLYSYIIYYFIKLKKRPKGDKFRTRVQKGYFIGFDDLYNRIIFIWNLVISKLLRINAITFLE